MKRRTCLVAAGTGASALLAGYLSEFSAEESNDNLSGDEEESPTGEESNGDEPENEPVDAVDEYLASYVDGDEERLTETVHNESPLQELLTADIGELEEIDTAERESTEAIAEDASTEDVWELELAEATFEEDEIDDLLDEEEGRLLEVKTEPPEAMDEDTWLLLTEDNEWKVFWTGTHRDIPDDPEEVFEDEIIDDENAVVEKIDYDIDVDEEDEIGPPQDYARIYFTDTPGIDAERVEVETTIGGYEGQVEESWSDAWLLINLHPDGDQIVVRAIKNGAEETVHREHYEP